jgi:hypothetical protein
MTVDPRGHELHDHGDPLSFVSALEMAVYAPTTILCPHCGADAELLPMYGDAWGSTSPTSQAAPTATTTCRPPERPI